jgi:hypothetical protein
VEAHKLEDGLSFILLGPWERSRGRAASVRRHVAPNACFKLSLGTGSVQQTQVPRGGAADIVLNMSGCFLITADQRNRKHAILSRALF